MPRFIRLGLLFIWSLTTLANAQPAWIKNYSSGLGESWDQPIATAVDDQGSIYVTGFSLRSGTSLDIVTIKYDANGVQQWLASFHGQSSVDDVPVDMIVDKDRNVYVLGIRDGVDRRPSDIVVIKYDANGKLIWSSRYDTPESRYEAPKAFVLDAAGNVYVTGVSRISGQQNSADYLTVKFNANGQVQWAQRFNSPNNLGDEAADIGIDVNGNVYVTGTSASAYATLKYSAAGALIWTRRYNGPGNQYGTKFDGARALIVDGAGNVYVTGYSLAANTSGDFATVKYDANGNEKWAVRNEVAGDDIPSALALVPSGNLVVAGRSDSRYIMLQYDVNGNRLWEVQYPRQGSSDAVAYLKVNTAGDIYFSGDGLGALKYGSNGVLQQTVSTTPGLGTQTGFAVDQAGNIIFIGRRQVGNDIDYLTVKLDPGGTEQWRAKYDGPGISDDYAIGLAVDANNHLIVTGNTAMIKYDANGNELWMVREPEHGAEKIVADKFGNIYTTGGSATVKYDNNGVKQWVSPRQTFNPIALAVDASANVYVTGFSYVSYEQYLWVTVKYNNQGVAQWTSTYTVRHEAETPVSHAVDDSGNVYVAGTTSTPNGGVNFTLLKYDAGGKLLWKVFYNSGSINNRVSAMTIERRNNRNFVYVTGSKEQQITTIKYNAAGLWRWVAKYSGANGASAGARAITLDQQGNIYIAGSEGMGESAWDYLLVKYNNDGAQQWAAKYNGTGNDEDHATALGVDPYGQIYVTGYSTGTGRKSDFATILYTPEGQVRWVERYNGLANTDDKPRALGLDAMGNVYVTGVSENTQTFDWRQYTTIKYNASKPVSVAEDRRLPATYFLGQNYPNPFNPLTTIAYELPEVAHVTIQVFDVLGEKVATLVDEPQSPGEHAVQWHAAGSPTGVYFYRMTAGRFQQTRKFLLVK